MILHSKIYLIIDILRKFCFKFVVKMFEKSQYFVRLSDNFYKTDHFSRRNGSFPSGAYNLNFLQKHNVKIKKKTCV